MTKPMTGYVEFGGGRVYYEVAGEGPALVLLHTGFLDSGMWDGQWRDFGQHHTVIRFDMRGFGKSDRAEEPVSRRHELYRVLEHIGVGRATLVGCSLGGEVILDFVLEHPEMVSGMIVVSAVAGGFEFQGEPPKHLLEMFAAAEQGDLTLASELQMRLWVDGPFRQPEQADPLVRRRAGEMSRAALAKGTWVVAHAPPPDPLDPPAMQRLGEIRVPTLIAAGELDNPEIVRAAEATASAIPGAKKVIFPGCAHLPNLEKPAEFNQTVLSFLEGDYHG